MLKEAYTQQRPTRRSDGAATRTPHTDALHPRRTTAGRRAVAPSDLQSRDAEKRAPPLYFESQTEASGPSKTTKDDLRTAAHVQLAHTYRYRCGRDLYLFRNTKVKDDRFRPDREH